MVYKLLLIGNYPCGPVMVDRKWEGRAAHRTASSGDFGVG
jgi:hypothetical protein